MNTCRLPISFRPSVVLFLLLIPMISVAQLDYKNAVYGEIGGNCGYYSINYERIFSKQIPVKVGLSILRGDLIATSLVGKYFGANSNFFELALGMTYGYYRKKDLVENINTYHEFLVTGFIGYRYQVFGERLLFRIGYTPFFWGGYAHGAGASLGYRF